MTVQATQQPTLLAATAPKAKASMAERASARAENTSFRDSMERAEQDAARAVKPKETEQPEAKEVQPESEPNTQEASATQEAEAATTETNETPTEPAMEEVGGAMEGAMAGVIEELLPKPEEEERTEEELLLEMGELAAMLQQPQAEATAPEAQPILAEQAVDAAAATVAPIVQEATKAVQGEAQLPLEQAEVPQDGEAQPMNAQTIAPEAAEQAGMESFARQAGAEGGEDNIMQAQRQETAGAEQTNNMAAETIFAARQPDATIDLTVPNTAEPLPAAEASRVFQQSIIDQVQTAAATGKDELYIQLKPETLGGLVIHLAMTEEGIKAQVRTASENIQTLVNTQIVQLEDAMRARDIPVVSFEVIYDPSAGNGFLQQRQQNWGGAQQGGGRGYGGVSAIEELGSVYEAAVLAAADAEDGLESVDYSA